MCVCVCVCVCVFHHCEQCCECNTSQMRSCVLLGYHALMNFMNGKIHFIISELSLEKLSEDYWLFQILMFPVD